MTPGAAPVPIIAVDGPAASGKGTVAARVARALGFHRLDSGALYRVVALKAIEAGVDPDDADAVAALARGVDVDFVDEAITDGSRDLSDAIRAETVSAAASRAAVHPGVRAALIDRQRAFASLPGLVADGRDMGTVVFPGALLKIFVTATAGERASRRHKQLIEKGNPVTLAGLLQEIRERDERDTTRSAAPLRPADDAIILDTTQLTIDAAVDFVLARYREVELMRRRS